MVDPQGIKYDYQILEYLIKVCSALLIYLFGVRP